MKVSETTVYFLTCTFTYVSNLHLMRKKKVFIYIRYDSLKWNLGYSKLDLCFHGGFLDISKQANQDIIQCARTFCGSSFNLELQAWKSQ